MSWISLVDYLRSVQFLLETEAISGPVNIVSPLPVSNREFSRQLSAALHRPLLARAPAWVLRLGMGEMAESLLLASQRVLPGKLLEAGFSWEDSDLASTFEKLLAKS